MPLLRAKLAALVEELGIDRTKVPVKATMEALQEAYPAELGPESRTFDPGVVYWLAVLLGALHAKRLTVPTERGDEALPPPPFLVLVAKAMETAKASEGPTSYLWLLVQLFFRRIVPVPREAVDGDFWEARTPIPGCARGSLPPPSTPGAPSSASCAPGPIRPSGSSSRRTFRRCSGKGSKPAPCSGSWAQGSWRGP